MGSKKGSKFERDIGPLLSLWWTHGKRDDVFWRRDSGARAKRRSREGKHTFGAHGDICAIDPVGVPLTNICTIELKNGYGKWSLMDVVDKPPMKKNQKNETLQPFEKFLNQILEDCKAVNTYPILITKRDKRQEVIILAHSLFVQMKRWHKSIPKGPKLFISHRRYSAYDFSAINLNSFLNWCKPEFFVHINNKNEN